MACDDGQQHAYHRADRTDLCPQRRATGRRPSERRRAEPCFRRQQPLLPQQVLGFDRVEGGTRANVGLRYTGSLDNGIGLRAVIGQSYHIAGLNSYATDDLLAVGSDSGLETDVSDIVASAGVELPMGLSVSTGVRLDEKTLELRRTDVNATYANDRLTTSVTYTQVAARPDYSFDDDNQTVTASSTVKMTESWSVFGSVNYDIDANAFNRRSVGISYADECTTFSVFYSDKTDPDDETANDWTIRRQAGVPDAWRGQSQRHPSSSTRDTARSHCFAAWIVQTMRQF